MKTGIKSQIVIVSAVAAVLLIVMSVCAIAESITFEKVAAMTVSSASSMGKRVILMHSTTVHGFLPTQTLLQNSMANRFLSRNPTRNSTKPIFGPSLPLGLKQT